MTDQVLQVLGPSTGGIRRHVATLAAGLQTRGWEVETAGPAGVLDGLWPQTASVAVGLGRSTPGAVRALRPLVARAQVVHAHGLTAGWSAWLAGAGTKLVVTVHNLVLDEAAGPAAPILRWFEARLPRRAREVIVISEPMRRRFDPKGTNPHLSVIAPVVFAPVPQRTRAEVRTELAVADGSRLVVLVGRLHPQKGIATLIDAVAHLPDGVQVVVAGEGPLRGELTAQIERLGLDHRVRLLGARSDAADLMAAADVVVVSSIWEGFGLVVAEALYLARPVVATDVGPVASMVADGVTGRLIPPGDPAALASALADLLADPQRAAAMGRAGAERVRSNFDGNTLVARVDALYRLAMEPSQ